MLWSYLHLYTWVLNDRSFSPHSPTRSSCSSQTHRLGSPLPPARRCAWGCQPVSLLINSEGFQALFSLCVITIPQADELVAIMNETFLASLAEVWRQSRDMIAKNVSLTIDISK